MLNLALQYLSSSEWFPCFSSTTPLNFLGCYKKKIKHYKQIRTHILLIKQNEIFCSTKHVLICRDMLPG